MRNATLKNYVYALASMIARGIVGQVKNRPLVNRRRDSPARLFAKDQGRSTSAVYRLANSTCQLIPHFAQPSLRRRIDSLYSMKRTLAEEQRRIIPKYRTGMSRRSNQLWF